MKAMINTERLLALARRHDWQGYCLYRLLHAAGIRNKQEGEVIHPFTEEELGAIPETLSYDAFRKDRHTAGIYLLDIAESLHGVDPLKSGGALLLLMAHEFFLPALPKDHPGYIGSLRLLRVFKAYIEGFAPAEVYMREAYKHRTTFCNVWGNKVDPEYENLFEAMPNAGLDDVIALGGWCLNSAWESFGRHLTRSMPGFAMLEDLHEGIDETTFVDDDEDYDREAAETAHQLIDEQMGFLRKEALVEFDDRLREIADVFLCGMPVQFEKEDVNGAA